MIECSSAIKSNGKMSFAKSHTEVEIFILREIKHACINRCCMISLKGGIWFSFIKI